MRNIFFLTIVLISVCFAFIHMCKNGVIELPDTHVELWKCDSIIDMGKLNRSDYTSNTVEWRIRNNTLIPLRIESVNPSCECMEVTLAREFAFRGECTVIHVRLNMEDMAKGVFYREVEVYGNFDSPIYLGIKGEVVL